MGREKRIKAKVKWGVCFAAFAAAISIFIILLQIEQNVLAQYEKIVVCVAAEEIPKGLQITDENCVRYFRLEETDKKCIPESALTDYGSLIGLVPLYDVEEGTLLSRGMFESIHARLGAMKEPVIAGFKAEDLYQVAGGILRAGDRIHVFRVSKENQAELCWEDVYVQSVFDQSGQTISNEDTKSCAQRINVYMDKGDLEKFYSDLAEGSLRVVKLCN